MAKGRKTGGRQPGSPNKTTVQAREAFQAAFEGIGGVEKLTTWADENPTEFYKHFARLIPIDVNQKSDGSLVIKVITGVPRAGD